MEGAMFRTRALVLALIACSALALGACGSDTAENNDYVDQVNQVTSELLASVQSIPATGGSPQRVSASLENVSTRLGSAATDLSEITPPEDVADFHVEIVQDLRTLQDEASNAADEVKAGGAAGAVGVVTQFVAEANRIGAQIDSAITDINDRLQS
jgi:aryl-alcohol dehydrogenase-like predicted oxidoreductase